MSFTPSTTFVGGGQKKLTVVPTNSVQSLSSTAKTFTAAPRKSLNWYQARKLYGMYRMRSLTLSSVCGSERKRRGPTEARTTQKFRGGKYVPSMHRKRSSDGRRSGIHGRNSGGVHWEVQEIFQGEWFRSVSKNKGEIRWQQARRETLSTGKGISQ